MAEQLRDEALNHAQLVKEKLDQVNGSMNGSSIPRDLRSMSIQNLKGLQVGFFKHNYMQNGN